MNRPNCSQRKRTGFGCDRRWLKCCLAWMWDAELSEDLRSLEKLGILEGNRLRPPRPIRELRPGQVHAWFSLVLLVTPAQPCPSRKQTRLRRNTMREIRVYFTVHPRTKPLMSSRFIRLGLGALENTRTYCIGHIGEWIVSLRINLRIGGHQPMRFRFIARGSAIDLEDTMDDHHGRGERRSVQQNHRAGVRDVFAT